MIEETETERRAYGAVQHKLRELCGMSCAQLAEASGLSWSSVSRYERRGPNSRSPSAEARAAIFGVFAGHPACAGWLTAEMLSGSRVELEAALAAYLASARRPRRRSKKGA